MCELRKNLTCKSQVEFVVVATRSLLVKQGKLELEMILRQQAGCYSPVPRLLM